MNDATPIFNTWEWTVDFWMMRANENLQNIIFFIGPKVDHNNYGDDLTQYPTLYTEVQNSKI